MPCSEPTRGQMTRAAVWQMESNDPNWTPMVMVERKDGEERVWSGGRWAGKPWRWDGGGNVVDDDTLSHNRMTKHIVPQGPCTAYDMIMTDGISVSREQNVSVGMHQFHDVAVNLADIWASWDLEQPAWLTCPCAMRTKAREPRHQPEN